MRNRSIEWFTRLLPQPNTAGGFEQMRACVGALFGLILTGALSYSLLGRASATAYLIAPMGASAVLLFCVPASPLAQPWSIIGGNLVSALIGVTCAKLFVDAPLLAAALAGCLAIAAMFTLRCLHPPSGAVALTAVLGGPIIREAGYTFVAMPVALNSILLVLTALFFNNATGRRYPHLQHSALQNIHDTKDVAPTARLGFTSEDLDAVLKHYDQVLDVSRDDLESIFIETEMHAYRRRFGVITCADIMSKDVITLEFATELNEAWQLMRQHQIHALPVLNRARRVIGIVSQSDFLKHSELDEYKTMAERFRHFISRTSHSHSDKPEVVGQIMTQHVKTASNTTPIIELVPLMANSGLHHIPVVNEENRFVGIVTQSDLVAALYESRLAENDSVIKQVV
ncbi:MAG: HPP family protein [Burkholderiaceae bacterium]